MTKQLVDLPEQAYPFTIEYIRASDDEVIGKVCVTGPGAIEVPSLVKKHGPMKVRLTYPKPGGGTREISVDEHGQPWIRDLE